ncbi:histidine kinase [Prolixibacteraceae bacterium JC049]|nr:histidine kinase [Prolixibacteraceae bacterium JC049]
MKDKIQLKKIGLHIAGWLVALFFFLLFIGRMNDDYYTTVVYTLALFPVVIAETYYIGYYLIPRFLMTKRYGKFVLYTVFVLITSFFLQLLLNILIFMLIANFGTDKYDPAKMDYLFMLVGLHFVVVVAVGISQINRLFEMQRENNLLEKRKHQFELKVKEAELQLLKAQIHPHFLFNTLNNLYGLALKKSDDAPELVIQLSNLLDYMLYRCNKELVSLQEELECLKNYIEIEKVRYGNRLDLKWKEQGDCKDIQIAPLLLLPFVENAFKHGASKDVGEPFIHFDLKMGNSELCFSVKNSVCFPKRNSESSGIGMNNVTKRLDFLYGERYELSVRDEGALFEVELKLNHLDKDV